MNKPRRIGNRLLRKLLAGLVAAATVLAGTFGCSPIPTADSHRIPDSFRFAPSRKSDAAIRKQAQSDPFPTAAQAGVRSGGS